MMMKEIGVKWDLRKIMKVIMNNIGMERNGLKERKQQRQKNGNIIGMLIHNLIKQELKDLDQMRMIMSYIGMGQDI